MFHQQLPWERILWKCFMPFFCKIQINFSFTGNIGLIFLLTLFGAVHKWYHPFYEIFNPSLPLVTHFTEYRLWGNVTFWPIPLPLSGWSHLLTTPLENNTNFWFFFSCTFHSVGTAAGEQKFNSLCVLSLNIINEKVYLLIWFWLFFITFMTAIHLVYRLFTIMMPYSRLV